MGANQSCPNSHHQQHGGKPVSGDEGSMSLAERRFRENFPNGYMTKEEFIPFYKKMFMSSLPEDSCESVFHAIDINKDEKVTFREYQIFSDILSSGSIKERLRLTFSLYDRDGSKGITRAEIVSMLKVLYQSKGWSNVDEKAEQNAGKILSAVDGDTDGTLTEDEFLEVASRDDLVCLVLGSE